MAAIERDNHGRWRPGQSANPGGRRRGMGEYIRSETSNGEELVDFWLSVLRDFKGAKDLRMAAAKELADRGFGKPNLAITGADGGPLDVAIRTIEVRYPAKS